MSQSTHSETDNHRKQPFILLKCRHFPDFEDRTANPASRRVALSEELRTALAALCEYLQEEERSVEAEPSDHPVFHSLSVVRAWLAETRGSFHRFEPGMLFLSAGAQERLEWEEVKRALSRHVRGDWGDGGEAARRANDAALGKCRRLVSLYHSSDHVGFRVTTEADRSATTVLLSGEA